MKSSNKQNEDHQNNQQSNSQFKYQTYSDQKQRFDRFSNRMIEQQKDILHQIDQFQKRILEMNENKKYYETAVQQLQNQRKKQELINSHKQSQITFYKQNKSKLMQKYVKQNKTNSNDLTQMWRWMKQKAKQYQIINKTTHLWKQAYQELNK